jgi:hypothetical protein
MTIPQNAQVPWLSLSFIVAALLAAGIYIFRGSHVNGNCDPLQRK